MTAANGEGSRILGDDSDNEGCSKVPLPPVPPVAGTGTRVQGSGQCRCASSLVDGLGAVGLPILFGLYAAYYYALL